MNLGPFILVHDRARELAQKAIREAPEGYVCILRERTRTLEQNALLHAALTDIAEQVEWKGMRFDVDTWKRLCTAACFREMGEQPEMIPALDGNGFDIVYARTSKMTVKQMTALIEWVHYFGAENGVIFKD